MNGPVLSWRWRQRVRLIALLSRLLPALDEPRAGRIAARLARRGEGATLGHFPDESGHPDDIVTANLRMIANLSGQVRGALLAVKAPPLGFDAGRLEAVARVADEAGLVMVLDAHRPEDADATLALAESWLATRPGTGIALPGRWLRSRRDAERFRDSSARIRIVKGEWAAPEGQGCDPVHGFIEVARILAGRTAHVGVATHDPELARQALEILLASGTPCSLEQLRGLPGRRPSAAARRLGVPVCRYVPFGAGWWPYALDKALARPYLPLWFLRDLAGH